MTPQMIMEGLNQVYDEVTYVTDVGQHQMWASQYLDVNKNKRMITSGGLGTMGFGFPQHLVQKWDTGTEMSYVLPVTVDFR